MKKINILFIDSSLLFRKGFAIYLNEIKSFNIVSDFSYIQDLRTRHLTDVDLLIFDTYCDEDYGIISNLKKSHPQLKTILFSSEERIFENYLFASTNHIDAFITKDADPQLFINTINRLFDYKITAIVHPKNIREQLYGQTAFGDSFFTPKELDVLVLLGKGKSTQEAAQILNKSQRTVETHRRRMIERIGCKNIIPVIIYAIKQQYLRLETINA